MLTAQNGRQQRPGAAMTSAADTLLTEFGLTEFEPTELRLTEIGWENAA